MSRVTRGISSVRHRINNNVLRRLLQGYIQSPSQVAVRDELLSFLDEVCEDFGLCSGSLPLLGPKPYF